jgi:drug/metabolite transporter (DMT)-like permease
VSAETSRADRTVASSNTALGASSVAVGTLLVVVSAVSFGVMPVITKLVYRDGASAVGLLSARFTIAGIVMLGLVRWRRQRLPTGRTLLALVALGGVCYAGESLCYFLALDHASAGVVALLLYLYPGIVVLLAAFIARRRPSRTTLGCLLAAVVGTGLTAGPSGDADALGVALGLGAAVSYALYIVLSGQVLAARRRGDRPEVSPLAASAVVVCATAVTDDVLALATGADYPRHASGWSGAVAVALVCTVVAMSAFFAGIDRIGASRTAIISTVEPVVSVALGVAVLAEPLAWSQGLGACLVLLAVGTLAAGGRRN